MSTEPETQEKPRWSPLALAVAALLLVMLGVLALARCAAASSSIRKRRPSAKKSEKGKGRRKEEEARVRDFASRRAAVRAEVARPTREARPLGDRQPDECGPTTATSSATRAPRSSTSENDPYPSRQHAVRAACQPARRCSPKAGPRRPKARSSFRRPIKRFTLSTETGRTRPGLHHRAASRCKLTAHAVVPIPLRGAGQGAVALRVHQIARLGEGAVRRRIGRRRHRRSRALPRRRRWTSARSIPLSDNPLTWTSIAYVLWDEVDPRAVHARAGEGASSIGSTGAASSSSAAPIRSTCSKVRSWNRTCRPTSGGPRTIAADDDARRAESTAG